MNEQQSQTRCFVQAKLSDFSNKVSQAYHKPVRGFFKDMLMGIWGMQDNFTIDRIVNLLFVVGNS